MNKKVLYTIAPMALVMSALVSCKGKATVTDLTASCNKSFEVGQSITKSDVKVTATWSNNTTTEPGDWTCNDFSNDQYTFVSGDVGEKKFTINYSGKSTELKVTVASNKSNIDWNKTVDDVAHGFNNISVHQQAASAKTIIFKKDSSTDGAAIGETDNDKIYAKYDSATTTLTVWSDNKICFEDDDMLDVGGSNYYGPFYYLTATKIDLANVDTSAMTNMSTMFRDCSSLQTIENIGNLNTSNATDMTSMFQNCSALTELDLSKFDTKKVESMSGMFMGCTALTSLDLSSFDSSALENISYMFGALNDGEKMKLESITFGNNFNTSEVRDMSMMFLNCNKLPSVDLSKFNTGHVSNMSGMFMGCSELTTLDLTNFAFDYLNKSTSMFEGCSKLETINVASGTDLSVEGREPSLTSADMFKGCTQLKGCNNTTYDSNVTDKTYARVDGGTSNKGYFSLYVTKQNFVDKANEWVTGESGFCCSKMIYKQSQVKVMYDGEEAYIYDFTYSGEGASRSLKITLGLRPFTVACVKFSGDNLSGGLKGDSIAGVLYKISNDEIVYKDENAESNEISELRLNKYGYATVMATKTYRVEFVYTGVPVVIGTMEPVTYSLINYYAYTENNGIPARTNYRLTATRDSSNNINYFEAINMEGGPYDISYNSNDGDVNITKIYKQSGAGDPVELVKETDFKVKYVASQEYHNIEFTDGLFSNGDKLIIECSIPKKIETSITLYSSYK